MRLGVAELPPGGGTPVGRAGEKEDNQYRHWRKEDRQDGGAQDPHSTLASTETRKETEGNIDYWINHLPTACCQSLPSEAGLWEVPLGWGGADFVDDPAPSFSFWALMNSR